MARPFLGRTISDLAAIILAHRRPSESPTTPCGTADANNNGLLDGCEYRVAIMSALLSQVSSAALPRAQMGFRKIATPSAREEGQLC